MHDPFLNWWARRFKWCGLVMAVALATPGCGRQAVVPDNVTLTIEPGVGITNVLWLGMTLGETKRSIPERVVVNSRVLDWRHPELWMGKGNFLLVPWLGAMTYVPNAQTKINAIDFHVTSKDLVRGMRIENPYRGNVRNGPSFESGVDREQIIAAFGKVREYKTNSVGPGLREPYSVLSFWEREEICYPRLGISFHLKTNRVHRISVFTPLRDDARNSATPDTLKRGRSLLLTPILADGKGLSCRANCGSNIPARSTTS